MSTLENGHFAQEPEMDVTDDILLPSVLRSLKPSPQITSAPQKLDENAEKWLKTLPWSYADAVRKPAPKKEEPVAVQVPEPVPEVAEAPEVAEVPQVAELPEAQEVPEPEVAVALEEPPQDKGEESGDVAGEADSGEDSDEEWNYISGKENRQHNQQQKEELSAEDMESQLNPNAAEFVPVYSTAVEPDIAGSPQKGMERSLENISIPSPNDFFKEICKRPSDIGVEYETSMNGDALNNLSTKAVFGDDSVCLNNSSVDLLSNSEPLKDTNPFAPSQSPNFVQDHFSIPDLCAQDDSSRTDGNFKPFSPQPQEDDSEICFMVGSDKHPDLISARSHHNETEVKAGDNSVNDVSEITFGDGLNVEEIIRSKQDSPLLRESPEPGLGSGVENNVDATLEDQSDKMPEFCSIQRTKEVENSLSNHGAAEGVSSHQGPETSVDSDSEQDDILVCPIKKDHNVENNKNESGETKLDVNHEKSGDGEVELESELVYHKDEDDEQEDCCKHSEIIVPESVKETLEKLETKLSSETHDFDEDENSEDEIIDHNAVAESSEFTTSNQNLNTNDFHTSKLVESEMKDILEHEVVQQSVEHSFSDILEPMTEFSNNISESKVEKPVSGFQEPTFGTFHDEQTDKELQSHIEESKGDVFNRSSIEPTSSPVDHNLESSSVSYRGEESVTSTEISHVELMDQDEWSRKVAELNQEMRESGMEIESDKDMFSQETPIHSFKNTSHHDVDSENDEPDKSCENVNNFMDKDVMTGLGGFEKNSIEVNSVPSEVTSYYHGEDPFSIKSVGIKHNEDVSSEEKNVPYSLDHFSSSASEKPIEESSTPVDEIVCKKEEVHEELICPVKLTPLNNETLKEEEQDVKESVSKIENEPTPSLENQIEKLDSSSEKDNEFVSQEYLAVCPMKPDVDQMYLNNVKEHTPELEKIDHIMGFSSFGKKSINSNMYETSFGHMNYKQVEEQFSINKEHDNLKNDIEEEMDQLCPLRKTSDEAQLQTEQKSDEIEQTSSQDEIPYTDEMSSSMIDHGEDKNLPEAQSNQLDLVQELQFEVQEKQTEGDNESDSGFEIINASEASTVEMEMMRYQSEKEAGSVNEKLLLDRNEAESFEKPDECVSNEAESNLVSNEIVSEKASKEESIIPGKEEADSESSPKHVPEPLERTPELELMPEGKAELVNGTVTPPATPPATPAPGLNEEAKEGLIAAAVAAAGAATAVAAVTTAVSQSKVEEKKSPVKKTDTPTAKAGTTTKAPLKSTNTKATSDKAPISKPSTPTSKVSTLSSKPLAKPSSPSTKTATASKTSSLTSSKPSTPTSKVGAKPATSKPSTPTGTKAAPSAPKPKPTATSAPKPPLSKPAPSAAAAKKPAAPSATAAKTTSTTSTMKPSAPKPAAAAKPLTSKPVPAKPATTAASAKPPAAKVPATKPAVTKSTPSSTMKPSSPSPRPSSAKSSTAAAAPQKTTTAAKPLAKPAPAKTTTAAKPPASTTGAKPAAKPPVKAAPPAPINKKPAAPTAIKKPAPTDKSTKEANNKLTAKTALNKKIVDKKVISKKEVIENEELPSQVAIVTTTNGHISLIENGMPPVEIAEEAN